MRNVESGKQFLGCEADKRWDAFKKDWEPTYVTERKKAERGNRPFNNALKRVVAFSASLITLH